MRTYEERARYILKQRDERLAKRRRIRTAVTMSAVSVCSLALIVGIGAAINKVIGKNGAVWISTSGASSGVNSGASGAADPKGSALPAETVYNPGDIHSTYKFTMPEFPDVDFAIDNGVVTAGGKELFGGHMSPVVYLADLNGDGCRELCTDWGVHAPTTPLDTGICALDFANSEYYVLSDPTGINEYHLSLEDGKLGYKYYLALKDQSVEKREDLALSKMKRVSEVYFTNNGEDLPVETVFIGTDSKFTMPELPDVNFTVDENGALTADGKTLFGGIWIETIYLADLNNDGFRELCTDWGMPVPGNALTRGICALDLVNDEYYVLAPSDPEGFEEYYLSINNGELTYTDEAAPKESAVGMQSAVTLITMKRVTDAYFTSKGQNLIVEKIYDYNSSENTKAAFEFTIPEFPGVSFKVEDYSIFANGKRLYSGMPIYSVYLADLNGDGYRELCSEIALGSGIVDMRILAYDYANSKLYDLSDRGKYDYTIAVENGVLKYKRYPYLASTSDTPEETGVLTLSAMKRVEDNGKEAPPAEKLYPRDNSDIERILEINDDFEFTIPELPESSFKLVKGVLSRDGETLLQGYPIHSIYLADLNGDGTREICAEYSVGEGIVDMGIFAYDPKTKERYKLLDTDNKEYMLTFENGILGYKHCVYDSTGITTDEQGDLTLSVMNKLCGLPKAPES